MESVIKNLIAMSAVAPFTIGTSPNVTFSSGLESRGVDMSLDDMIAARRKEAQAEQKQKQQSKDKDKKKDKETGNNKKGNIRSGIKKTQREAAKSKKPTNAQKAVGSGKAKRNAKLANKRGISNDTKATPMEVEREVYRQQRTGGGRGGGGGGNGRTRSETQPRRSERNRNNKQNQNQNRSVADRNVKAKNKKQREQQQQQTQKQKQKQQNVVTPAPPTKKAMKAAMNALKDTGYVAPRGMKMVVSFVDGNTAKNTNSKPQGNKNQQKKQIKTNNNNNNNGGNGNRNNNNNNGRSQNGNRRGGGGRR